MRFAKAILKAKRVYLIGNGGSAANCIHIANDFIAAGIKAHALTADVATLTCIANDHAYTEIFSRQIKTLVENCDLVIALSGSGNSQNVTEGLKAAKEKGAATFLITGAFAEIQSALQYADKYIRVGRTMQEAEERQIYFGHRAIKWLMEGT